MKVINSTQFKHFVFDSLDAADRRITIGIVQGTFRFRPRATMSIHEEQAEINLSDEYFGQPLHSSLRVDSQLAPIRLGTDVTLEAVAHAPRGNPAESWLASVRVGQLFKQIQVTGRRRWTFGLGGWKLSPPEPTTTVPVRYELAYGGTYRHKDNTVRFEKNPIGQGFINRWSVDINQPVTAPQIEDPNAPVRDLLREYEPVGLGPIPKHCLPRRLLCGTADENWKKTRWPLRPADFEFAYYNAAPPGLWSETPLRGNEPVELIGLSESDIQQTYLPDQRLVSFVLSDGLGVKLTQMKLDSVHLVPHQELAILTWRTQARKDLGLKVMQFLLYP